MAPVKPFRVLMKQQMMEWQWHQREYANPLQLASNR